MDKLHLWLISSIGLTWTGWRKSEKLSAKAFHKYTKLLIPLHLHIPRKQHAIHCDAIYLAD